jgi:two-component system, OmpR family, phosphate regulon sensor histidine kinase PhoR
MSSMSGQFGLPVLHRALSTPAKTGPTVVWSTPEPENSKGGSDFAAILLAIAAHDLRQPLQMMQHTHDALGRGIRTKSELKLLESGKTAIERMDHQLKELLGALLLHHRAGRIELSTVRVDPLLRQACHENREIASQKDISVRVVGTGASVVSDPLLLGVILRNLVSNAVKYTNPGGRVLVGCRHFGPTVRIDVLDTGVGIVGATMPRLFEALTRLDPERSDGLGIGLFIVRKAADLLGHRIDVSSAPYRGSRFSIVAPGVD